MTSSLVATDDPLFVDRICGQKNSVLMPVVVLCITDKRTHVIVYIKKWKMVLDTNSSYLNPMGYSVQKRTFSEARRRERL